MTKKSIIIWSVAVGIVALSWGYGSHAQPGPVDPMTKIGIVSISQILNESQVRIEHIQMLRAKQAELNQELQTRAQELETLQAQLQTYKEGTEDYLTQSKDLELKKAELNGLQKFYEQAIAMQDQQWTQDFYQKVLASTQKVADVKGLTMVLERSDPEFPVLPDMFVMTVRTHKVLYSKGCYDITADVIAEIDQ